MDARASCAAPTAAGSSTSCIHDRGLVRRHAGRPDRRPVPVVGRLSASGPPALGVVDAGRSAMPPGLPASCLYLGSAATSTRWHGRGDAVADAAASPPGWLMTRGRRWPPHAGRSAACGVSRRTSLPLWCRRQAGPGRCSWRRRPGCSRAGSPIAVVGTTVVFVPQDLAYLHAHAGGAGRHQPTARAADRPRPGRIRQRACLNVGFLMFGHCSGVATDRPAARWQAMAVAMVVGFGPRHRRSPGRRVQQHRPSRPGRTPGAVAFAEPASPG